MKRQELVRRYALLAIALIISAAGVSLVVRSNLGTSPISSWAYVLSLHTPLTIGSYSMMLNTMLIIGQMMMLGRRGTSEHKADLLLQIPVSMVFSVSMDATMYLFQNVVPDNYAARLAGTVMGCGIMSFGIALQVKADVSMNSGEYFVQVMSKKFKRPFGTLKIGFDVALVLLAVVTALLFAGRIEGVREGTVIVALMTGPLVKLFSPHIDFITHWLQGGDTDSMTSHIPTAERPVVITIGRQYGSGGHMIGRRLAEQLSLPFYDNELITLAARESGFSEEEVSGREQNIPNGLLYQMIYADYASPLNKSLSPDDALFVAQGRVMLQLVRKGPCVIMGRCADYLLRNDADCVRVFLHADDKKLYERAQTEYGLTANEVSERVNSVNNSRREHYKHFTGRTWDDANNYDLTLNTGIMSDEAICRIIEEAYAERLHENKA